MNKIFWEIFPRDKKQWKRYFEWVVYESKSVHPIFLILKIILTSKGASFLTVICLYIIVSQATFPDII